MGRDFMPEKTWGLLGVPSTAGSHNPGQDKAPAAWRTANLARARWSSTAST